ncbi:sensor histidine kinase [Moritella viscosa]|uniref:histidine kinase n=1 Tax=Moritella viscosa TaxID=80854 RepID=A0ABY1HLU5_9GAMM|nr:ATP-binding protein [Moritella viscosa]CED59195.1 sensor protein, histidine kinase [Moritella viscosa]SGZ03770.1 C4-dicarboxylate transport sensor protein, putative [Moritella viscosa]SGZ17968.1 C4-dicarboxylate transport sensor protein, putative [Moritella viscosa]SHO00335.1 C4-dicarboxylate transport sensor protein, putative [Moritella viscosa]SHO20270.1 C4-dicarboxylate transport sensor protein, putative [Moritella viscosa]
MSNKFKIIASIILGCVIATTFAVREICRDWLLNSAREQAENQLLTYVVDIRRVLASYKYLPYLITEQKSVTAVLTNPQASTTPLKHTLTQFDKAANTKGWYLLQPDGSLLISSRHNANWDQHKAANITANLHNKNGELDHDKGVLTSSYIANDTANYYLSLPINLSGKLIGIAVIEVDLTALSEPWLTANEFILISNTKDQFFLSSHPQISATKMNMLGTNGIKTSQLSNDADIYHWKIHHRDYQVQQVELDDLKWHIYYLTPLSNLYKTVDIAGFITAILMSLLLSILLYRHERRQKLYSHAALKQMIAGTNVGLVLLNDDRSISYINPTAMHYFGLNNDDKYLYASQLLSQQDDNKHIIEQLNDLSEIPTLTGIEVFAHNHLGHRFPALLSITPLAWSQQRGSLMTFVDISKRKRAEHALSQANAQLETRVQETTAKLYTAQEELLLSSKMAALGRMSSAINHELNQPLTGIRTLLSSNMLFLEQGNTKVLRSNMALIDKLVSRMLSMTAQLKVFVFNRPERLIATSITDILTEVFTLQEPKLSNIDIKVDVPDSLPQVLAEPHRLHQVFANLISNAAAAMQHTSQPQLSINANLIKGIIYIKVTDNGFGVDDDALAHLFEPFYTSKKIGEGLGLGLAITANIMRDMQGEITAHNNQHQAGMTFTLTLQTCNHN